MAISGIDRNNTYFIIEDENDKTWKMPLNVLGDIIIMNDLENDKVLELIEAIDELSAYILELSSEFVSEHYSYEELSTLFELKDDVDYLLIDKSILTEKDIPKHIADTGIIPKDKVDMKYEAEEADAESVFDKLTSEAESYIAEPEEDNA